MSNNAQIYTTTDGDEKAIERSTQRKGALVVRRNDLMLGSHRMSLQEMRLFLWLVAQVQRDDEGFKSYRLAVKDFQELVGIEGGGNLYTRMLEITRGLMQRVVQVNDYDEKVLRQRPLLSGADYRYGEGYVDLKLHPDLKPYILNLSEKFTSIELDIAVRLKSTYSVRLYEVLKAEQFKGGTRSFALEELRKLLGVDADQYERFNNFRQRVLEPASKELSNRTDLAVDYRTVRTGQSVKSVTFKVTERLKPMGFAADTRKDKLFKRLKAMGMHDSEVMQVITDWADEDVGRIEYHLDACKDKDKPLAWFRVGIRKDFRPNRSLLAELAEQKKQAAVKREQEQRLLKAQPIRDERVKGAFDELINKMSGDEKKTH